MDRATYERVLDDGYIEHGGQKYAWTIPLAFPVTAELAGKLGKGRRSRSSNSARHVVATLEISDVFAWDKPAYFKSVYGTERTDHPGADMVLKNDGRQDAPDRRHDPRPAAAEAPALREVRALAARGPRALPREGLGARRRVPDAEPAPPRARVRARLRARDARSARA
jgi:hypothetical protein